jgi:hypothetical protein
MELRGTRAGDVGVAVVQILSPQLRLDCSMRYFISCTYPGRNPRVYKRPTDCHHAVVVEVEGCMLFVQAKW